MGKPTNERLKAVRTALKLTQRDFSEGIFLRQSSLARIEQGKTALNGRIIELVCSKYSVSKTYLKDGTGEMFGGNPPAAKLERLSLLFDRLNETYQDYLIVQAKELLKIQQKDT